MNADAVIVNTSEILNTNLFIYCLNNPITYYDKTGYAVEVVFDVASTLWSLFDLVITPSWLNFGFFLWDLASVFVPFIPGSYVAKGGKIALKVASKIDDFVKGSEFLTDSYKVLKKLFKGIKNIEIHHLVEKRFRILFDVVPDEFLSIPLTKDLHKIITQRWRDLYKINSKFKWFKYGSNYTKINRKQMEAAIKEVYKDMPELLAEVLSWFRKHWKGN